MPKTMKVTERALLKRINRRLSRYQEQIRKCRENSHRINQLGAYYWVDLRDHTLIGPRVNIEALARDESILRDSEQLVWD
jgi:hypothetical protein